MAFLWVSWTSNLQHLRTLTLVFCNYICNGDWEMKKEEAVHKKKPQLNKARWIDTEDLIVLFTLWFRPRESWFHLVLWLEPDVDLSTKNIFTKLPLSVYFNCFFILFSLPEGFFSAFLSCLIDRMTTKYQWPLENVASLLWEIFVDFAPFLPL